jgi:hypothetical protein
MGIGISGFRITRLGVVRKIHTWGCKLQFAHGAFYWRGHSLMVRSQRIERASQIRNNSTAT